MAGLGILPGMETLATTLSENRTHLARLLHHPHNLGVELRDLTVGGADGLLLWIVGLASPTMIQMGVL
jgi:hypothetical protein